MDDRKCIETMKSEISLLVSIIYNEPDRHDYSSMSIEDVYYLYLAFRNAFLVHCDSSDFKRYFTCTRVHYDIVSHIRKNHSL